MTAVNDKAEKTLETYATILIVAGIITFIICLIFAIEFKAWDLIIRGIICVLASLVGSAFVRVFVNISRKLDEIKNLERH